MMIWYYVLTCESDEAWKTPTKGVCLDSLMFLNDGYRVSEWMSEWPIYYCTTTILIYSIPSVIWRNMDSYKEKDRSKSV